MVERLGLGGWGWSWGVGVGAFLGGEGGVARGGWFGVPQGRIEEFLGVGLGLGR